MSLGIKGITYKIDSYYIVTSLSIVFATENRKKKHFFKMHGVFTNVLWYIEFFAFAGALIVFFYFILYLAQINYVNYNPQCDKRRQ